MDWQAAEAVVHSLQRQENLAKAMAWKANMQVRRCGFQVQGLVYGLGFSSRFRNSGSGFILGLGFSLKFRFRVQGLV